MQKTGTQFSLKKKSKNTKNKQKSKNPKLLGKSLKVLDFWISIFWDFYEKYKKTNGNIWIFRIW